MTDDGKPTRPAEGTDASRRTKLPGWSRDVTGEGGGFVFGGIAPEVIAGLKARDAGQPEKQPRPGYEQPPELDADDEATPDRAREKIRRQQEERRDSGKEPTVPEPPDGGTSKA